MSVPSTSVGLGGASDGYLRGIDARISLAPDLSSPARARRFVDQILGSWGCHGLVDVAELLVSEVVTNALLHGRTQAELTVRLEAGRLRVEVADGNPKHPVRKHYAEDAGTGRGIGIVEQLASAWGVEGRPGGKKVWFELTASGSLPPDATSYPKAEDGDGASTSEGHGDDPGRYRPRLGAGGGSESTYGRPGAWFSGLCLHPLVGG